MKKQKLIEHTLNTIHLLPLNEVKETADYANFLLKRHDEKMLRNGIQQMIVTSKSFEFVIREEENYSLADLKEVYLSV